MKKWLLVPAIMLFLALLPMPYGYFTLLRCVVCVSAIVIIAQDYKNTITLWIALFGVITILFNPVFPIRFYRNAWTIADTLAGILFLIKSIGGK